jgi:hypothetical protein
MKVLFIILMILIILVALIMVGLTVYAIFNEDFRKKMFGSKK